MIPVVLFVKSSRYAISNSITLYEYVLMEIQYMSSHTYRCLIYILMYTNSQADRQTNNVRIMTLTGTEPTAPLAWHTMVRDGTTLLVTRPLGRYSCMYICSMYVCICQYTLKRDVQCGENWVGGHVRRCAVG